VREEVLQVVLGGGVGGVEAGAAGSAGGQDAVGVERVGQVLLGGQAPQGVVAAVFGSGLPAVRGPGDVLAEDDGAVVVFHALGGVDAADLLVAALVGGPERPAGGVAAGELGVGACIPGPLPGVDSRRIAPRDGHFGPQGRGGG
jgi:hypothetical protein